MTKSQRGATLFIAAAAFSAVAVTTLSAAGILEELQVLLKSRQAMEQKLAALIREQKSTEDNLSADVRAEAGATSEQAKALFREAIRTLNQTLESNKAGQAETTRALAATKARLIALCGGVDTKLAQDRMVLQRQQATNAASREELERWMQLNVQAQRDALLAGVKFLAQSYAADAELMQGSVRKLQRHVEQLARKGRNARTDAARTRYVNQMTAAIDRLAPAHSELVAKTAAGYADDLSKRWELVRDNLHHDVRVAQKDNETLQSLLASASWKEALIGDDLDTPGIDALSTIIEEIGANEAKLQLGLKQFEQMTGPAIRAFTFARDASYNALLSYESTQRVLQQSDEVAKLIALAGTALQREYKSSIDARNLCWQQRLTGPSIAAR